MWTLWLVACINYHFMHGLKHNILGFLDVFVIVHSGGSHEQTDRFLSLDISVYYIITCDFGCITLLFACSFQVDRLLSCAAPCSRPVTT